MSSDNESNAGADPDVGADLVDNESVHSHQSNSLSQQHPDQDHHHTDQLSLTAAKARIVIQLKSSITADNTIDLTTDQPSKKRSNEVLDLTESTPDDNNNNSNKRICAENNNTNSTQSKTNIQPARVHLLPCRIAYSGPSDVDVYFHPTPALNNSNSSKSLYSAAFRGRELLGEKLILPSNAAGFIFQEKQQSQSQSQQQKQLNTRRQSQKSSNTTATAGTTADNNSTNTAAIDNNQINWQLAPEGGGRFNELIIWHRDNDSACIDRSSTVEGLTIWPTIAAAIHKPITVKSE